jgi:hypothetical protein
LNGQRVFTRGRSARPARLHGSAVSRRTGLGMWSRNGGGSSSLRHGNGDGRQLVAGRRQACAGRVVMRLLRSPCSTARLGAGGIQNTCKGRRGAPGVGGIVSPGGGGGAGRGLGGRLDHGCCIHGE